MSRKVNQVMKTGRSFSNYNDQACRMNSRGDSLEYRRAEQIGLEVEGKKNGMRFYALIFLEAVDSREAPIKITSLSVLRFWMIDAMSKPEKNQAILDK